MPKRPEINSILIIGSGPIIIGQACEFDYAGSQALRSLREDGIETIFPDRKTRIIVLINLIRIGYVDGAFEIEEECLLRDLANSFDIELDEFELLDNWVKRLVGLEKEAQALF